MSTTQATKLKTGLPCFLPQCLKWTALQCLSQYQVVVLKKKKVGLREKKVILAKGKNKTLFAKSVRYLMVLIFAVKGNNFRDK